MKFSKLLGTDIKEFLKKIRFKYQNRNFKPYTVDRTLYGTDFKFYVANLDAQDWYLDETSISSDTMEWMWPEMEFIKNNICKPGDMVLECGGHHGLTAVVISKWIGNGQLYTFEPNPDNLAIIKKNVEINDVKNITVVPDAVGAEDGEIWVTNSSSNSYILKGNEHNGIKVPVVKLDDYAHLNPTVIKIDVEGFELEVLKGACQILKTLPRLAIEMHPVMINRYGGTVSELINLLDPAYELWIQEEIYGKAVFHDRSVPIPFVNKGFLFAIPR
ncbi:MAG: FkbM family methyltransferase [Mucilaginibacter sp.]